LASSLDLSGKTVTLPAASVTAHATTTQWQAVTTGTTLTAVAGRGYPINTTSNLCTVTLPAVASVGDTIELVDYAGTWDSYNVILTSSLKIKGGTDDLDLQDDRQGVRLVYVDVTQGWVAVTGVNESSPALAPPNYPKATGPDGAVGVTDGDYKYHIFTATKTGSSGFSVSAIGNADGSTAIEYLVCAGGGSGGYSSAGGGGGGGYRTNVVGENTGGGGSAEAAMDCPAIGDYDITIGAGGTGISSATVGNDGSNSIMGTTVGITSTGGGGGGYYLGGNQAVAGRDGGSGGGEGGGNIRSAGQGGDALTPTQGYAGGVGDNVTGTGSHCGAGGGGANEIGQNANVGSTNAGDGGDGMASSITGSSVTRCGGGGGSTESPYTPGAGGAGGGTAGGVDPASSAANTGGGAGAAHHDSTSGGNGGSGVVIIRYKFKN
jgi:hypothetical protein